MALTVNVGILARDKSLLGLSYERYDGIKKNKQGEEKDTTFHEIGIGCIVFYLYLVFY